MCSMTASEVWGDEDPHENAFEYMVKLAKLYSENEINLPALKHEKNMAFFMLKQKWRERRAAKKRADKKKAAKEKAAAKKKAAAKERAAAKKNTKARKPMERIFFQ